MKNAVRLLCLLLCGTLFVSCTPESPPLDWPSEEPEPVVVAEEHITKAENGYVVTSPDSSITFTLSTENGLSYTVDRNGVRWVEPSTLGAMLGTVKYGEASAVTDATVSYVKEDRELLGNQSLVKCRAIESVFSLTEGEHPFFLDLRVYNNGVAFRYRFPEGSVSSVKESTTYALRSDISECWYSVYTGALGTGDYEAVPEKHTLDEKNTKPVYPPLLAIVGDNAGYLSLMEGDINASYPATTLRADGDGVFGTSFVSGTQFAKNAPMTTAWRLINFADDLNGIVNNYNIDTLSPLPDETLYSDTSWITPGRSTWSWVAEGPFGELGWGGIPTETMMTRYIDVAAKLGYEYNIIDDGWPKWNDYKAALSRLGALGRQNHVKQILWGGVTSGTDGFNKMQDEAGVDAYMALLKETGMSGAKIDFWWPESNTRTTEIQQYILKQAAKEQFVIDFHGCNKPSGFQMTYPNELTREGIHGGEYYQMASANIPEYASFMTSQLFTRYLCGHADWTPGSYTAMEIASIVCIDSPLMVNASKPEDILNSPAVEFIKSIPTVWDQTRVLSESRVGKYAVYAKEKSGVWFVGGIASEEKAGASVNLAEFLPDGTYTMEMWVDVNGEMMYRTRPVTKNEILEVGDLKAGDGYVVRLSKLTMNQYGGEIQGDIHVEAPDKATVKYTVDGSDPMTSDTAKTYKDGITLAESCRLTVAITKGEGKGTAMSYQFNKIS